VSRPSWNDLRACSIAMAGAALTCGAAAGRPTLVTAFSIAPDASASSLVVPGVGFHLRHIETVDIRHQVVRECLPVIDLLLELLAVDQIGINRLPCLGRLIAPLALCFVAELVQFH